MTQNTYIVAYDPTQKTTIEIWSDNETLFARLPSGEVVVETNANEVLKAVVQSETIRVHRNVPIRKSDESRFSPPYGSLESTH